MARFKKGSAAAKAYMAKLRGMVGKRKTKVLNVSSPSKVSRKNPTMARRRYGRYRARRNSGGMTIPLAPVLGLVAGLAGPAQDLMKGDYNRAAINALYNYTGYNMEAKVFNAQGLINGLMPLVMGLLVHKFVGGKPLGLNAVLARAKVPFIRI